MTKNGHGPRRQKEAGTVNGWACSAHGCGQVFASLSGFDRHRVGVHAYTLTEGLRMEPPRYDGRRCLDTEEMEAWGWHQDNRGCWKLPLSNAQEHRLAGMRAERQDRRSLVAHDAGRAETRPGDPEPIPGLGAVTA
jgi:hypothetical protein